MKKKQDTPSPAIEILDITYHSCCESVPSSWQTINSAMQDALKLAIVSGFRFDIDDFKYIVDGYKSDYWIGADVERWYSMAVAAANKSAFASYEHYKNRKGIIADNVTHDVGFDRVQRQKDRLAVGSQFKWNGQDVSVTSFSDDGLSVVACSYKDGDRRKIDKRYSITADDIKADRAIRNQRKKLVSTLMQFGETLDGGIDLIKKTLGASTQKEFDALPNAKLQEAIDLLSQNAVPNK